MKVIDPITVTEDDLVSSVAEDEPVWDSGTTYGANVTVRGTGLFEHKLFVSLQAANLNKVPGASTSSTWWLETGATNRWRMFDASLSSQTADADEISVTITLPDLVTGIALLNIEAATAHIVVTDAVEGVVWDVTYDLTDPGGIVDPYAYAFDPILRRADLVELELPAFAGAEIEITLSDPGNTVRWGVCALGRVQDLGGTQWGPVLGIQDFSVIEQDAFANYRIVERAFIRKASFALMIENRFVDALMRLLSGFRAKAVVYIGDEDFGSTIVFGFYEDFSTAIPWPTRSLLSINLKGLPAT